MARHEDARPELDSSAPDIVVVTALPAGQAAVAPAGSSTAARPRPRTGRTALAVALLVVLVVTPAGAVQRSRRDDVVAEPAQRSTTAPSAPAPAPLTLSVTLPAPVVAGQPAEITVRYADGDGRFGGSTEEWGDGVGGASAKQGPC